MSYTSILDPARADDDTLAVVERAARLADRGHGQDARWLGSIIAGAAMLEDGPGARLSPADLTARLLRLRDALRAHHASEQLSVFPLMRRGERSEIQYSVCRMMDEHRALTQSLDELCGLVAGHNPAEQTGGAWPAWKMAFEALDKQLRARLAEEEQEIFLRFF